MWQDEAMLRDRIEVATEELSRIPRTPWNAVKVADRERELRHYRDQLARMERTHRAFLDRRHELLSRCRMFGQRH